MRSYQGRRTHNGPHVTRREDETGQPCALPLRLDLGNHSPTGFEWSYGGSGPAQLALALLADALGDDEQAARLHQAFKWEVVARLPAREDWTLTDEQVRAIAAELEARRKHPEGL